MWERVSDRIYKALFFLLVATAFVLFGLDSRFVNDPKQPDLATGHTIPVPIRGVGTVYVTPAEYEPNTWLTDAAGIVVCFILLAAAYDAYLGFKKGWNRSD